MVPTGKVLKVIRIYSHLKVLTHQYSFDINFFCSYIDRLMLIFFAIYSDHLSHSFRNDSQKLQHWTFPGQLLKGIRG